MSDSDLADIFDLCTLNKTGLVETVGVAHQKGYWIGSFNLWIVQRYPEPAILYQQRSYQAAWAPGLLDVSAGGHYHANEDVKDGLREVKEELGKEYDFDKLVYLGKKFYMKDDNSRKLRYIIDVFLHEDNSELSTYTLQREELEGLYLCPVADLLDLYDSKKKSFVATGMGFREDILCPNEIEVSLDSFPLNHDRYHEKMTVMINWYFHGERHLIY